MKRSLFFPCVILMLFLFAGMTGPVRSQDPGKTFQKGLVKEEGEGSLQEAIDLYTRVANNTSAERSLRAQALLHVGICYEKLGREQARRAYRTLITDFADQEEIVAIGKKNLASLDAGSNPIKSGEMILREVWVPGGDTYGVSPDGRYLNYIDWDAIELAVRDLNTGKSWYITQRGTWEDPIQFPDISLWSPDGKELAYYWFHGENTEIWIASLDGSRERLVCSGKELPWPIDWSPDGKHLLAIKTVEDPEHPMGHYDRIVLLSVEDGAVSDLKTFGDPHTCHLQFSPDGKYIAADLGCSKRGESGDIYLFSIDGKEEGWLVENPADDRDVIWMPDGSGILFLSDRMGTTDLWKLRIEDGQPMGEPEIIRSNLAERTMLLRITDDHTLIFNQSFARSDLFLAELDILTGEVVSKPSRISTKDGIRNVNPAWSPDGRYVAYLKDGQFDYQLGNRYLLVIHDTENGQYRELETELYGIPHDFWWNPTWKGSGNSILLNGSRKDFQRGFYMVDIETGKETPVLVSKSEPREFRSELLLPQCSEDGKNLYYLNKDKTTILRRNLETGNETRIFSSEHDLITYSVSPDEKQIVLGFWPHHRNRLYTVPVSGGELRELTVLDEDQRPRVLAWTSDNEYVIISTRRMEDQDTHEILRIPLSGEAPQRVVLSRELFPKGYFRDVDLYPGGKKVLFVVDTGNDSGVWALENIFADPE